MSNVPLNLLQAVPFTAVSLSDEFWAPRLEINRRVTIPYDFQRCEETERIANFARAAGRMDGPHVGIFFNDSDVFKVIEGAAYSLRVQSDPALEAFVDKVVALIAAAQEPDGYLYTARTIDPEAVTAERQGLTRWSNLRVNHELYNVGHLYEAAVAYYQATGKRALLDVALKNADLIDQVFGPDKKRDVPGHQEIELGLVKLYQVTGEERYLHLAKFFLDERGQANGRELYESLGNSGYMQDHQPVREQTEAVGHAVRAAYMYSGMADVAALTGDTAYIDALDAIWEDVVARKLYLTGGIGARHHGEAFGEAYELPNATAYSETCASIANIFWNQRMFLLHRHAKYIDVLERTLYNGFLAGIGLSGRAFFYPNPLAFDGHWDFNRGDHGRQPWFDCACCPTNVVRLMPALPGYVYATDDEGIFVNLYIAGNATVELSGGLVHLTQQSDYPWSGQIMLTLQPSAAQQFTLRLRWPGWAQGHPLPSDLYRYLNPEAPTPALTLNGQAVEATVQDGFLCLTRTWQPDDVLELTLPMPIRRVVSHPDLTDNAGLVALERGPLVYCVEGLDHGGSLADVHLPDSLPLEAVYRPELLNGLSVLQDEAQTLTALPYYAWAHRGRSEMAVWLPRR